MPDRGDLAPPLALDAISVAPRVRAGTFDRHQTADRPPLLGDREPFIAGYPLEQGGQISTGEKSRRRAFAVNGAGREWR